MHIREVGLTVLRSPLSTHHDPAEERTYLDLGGRVFARLLPGPRDGDALQLAIAPYEIKTFRVWLA